MDEVIRKRMIGAALLIIIGITVPVLLSRCMHSPAGGDQAMRVYEIQPAGGIKEIGVAADDKAGAATQMAATEAGSAEATGHKPPEQTIAAATLAGESQGETGNSGNNGKTGGTSNTDGQTDIQPVQQPKEPPANTQTTNEPAEKTPVQTRQEPQGLAGNAPSGSWVVQVASFPAEQDARAMATQLDEAYSVFYTAAQVKGDTWYRVRIGPFDSEAEAKNAAAELRAQGRDTLVAQVD